MTDVVVNLLKQKNYRRTPLQEKTCWIGNLFTPKFLVTNFQTQSNMLD